MSRIATEIAVDGLRERYLSVRTRTDFLVRNLSAEDACVQSMPDTSPTKWHLAHTTWFFETFVLEARTTQHQAFDPDYRFLFNSYYNAVGAQYTRAHRGLITRPDLATVRDYRHYVDDKMLELLQHELDPEILAVVEVGLHHEQQHQELVLMDIKHLFSCNPRFPAYTTALSTTSAGSSVRYLEFQGGITQIGARSSGFSFDNERPRHDALVPNFQLGSRLVTNGDYLDFICDRAYSTPLLWLADGWATIQRDAWAAPLYWYELDGVWHEFTLSGLRELNRNAPVVHLSYYEADAYARWANARLPTEMEWELAAEQVSRDGNFVEDAHLHPQPVLSSENSLAQMFGDVWEWTMSPYTAYPGFKAPIGAIGEYNGKFMSGQMVLRGGACVTPREHIRSSYRNFFYPGNRWQFAGMRLARDSAKTS
ncbi:MAG: ergothioneine biosynthesis protein EgtB [Proteobacteria bacterium]|nr:ergothioneine biosynthesis protein EgtB [Pseudomonadota bacterium]